MDCGLLKSLLTTLAAPALDPAWDGVKVTLTVQDAPGARVRGQLLLAAKSPVVVMVPSSKSALVEGLLSCTVWAALVVPTAWAANVNLLGASLTDWPVPRR